MSLRIVFNHPFDHLTGTKCLEITLQQPLTLVSLFQRLMEQFPSLKKRFIGYGLSEILTLHMTVLKNRQIAKCDTIVEEGDTVKFFSPLSGG